MSRTVRRRPRFVSEVSAGPVAEKGLRAAQQPRCAPRAARLLFSAPSTFHNVISDVFFPPSCTLHHHLKLQRFSTQPSAPRIASVPVLAARDSGGIVGFSDLISSDLPLIASLHGASSIELALLSFPSASGQAFLLHLNRLTLRVRRKNAPHKNRKTRPPTLGCFERLFKLREQARAKES